MAECDKQKCRELYRAAAIRLTTAHHFNEDLTIVLSAIAKALLTMSLREQESRKWILEAQAGAERLARKAEILLKTKG